MQFSELHGMTAAARPIQKAFEHDRMPGAYLFSGPQYCGKTTLAVALASLVSCKEPDFLNLDSCAFCDSCRRIAAGVHPEIHLIKPFGEQTQIWQFWDRENRPQGILTHTLPYAPSLGKKRVYILERADALNETVRLAGTAHCQVAVRADRGFAHDPRGYGVTRRRAGRPRGRRSGLGQSAGTMGMSIPVTADDTRDRIRGQHAETCRYHRCRESR